MTLGIRERDGLVLLRFFNRELIYDGHNFIDPAGDEVPPAVKLVLCRYMMGPETPVPAFGRFMTFREFPGAGPLFSRFVGNTSKIIETSFSGQLSALEKRCRNLDGQILETDSHDLKVRFEALPRIPILFSFNDAEDGMPAQAGFLFQDNARAYLDLKSLSIISTCLTGSLIRPYNEGHESHEPESDDQRSPARRPGNACKDYQNVF
ncbi:MAG: DUF3786 domain-containing protein [Desulfobacula sp.]|nr:DUF3786 domain-containing protein [Desulfobacula sp.]